MFSKDVRDLQSILTVTWGMQIPGSQHRPTWERMNILNIPAEILISEEKKKRKKMVLSGMILQPAVQEIYLFSYIC